MEIESEIIILENKNIKLKKNLDILSKDIRQKLNLSDAINTKIITSIKSNYRKISENIKSNNIKLKELYINKKKYYKNQEEKLKNFSGENICEYFTIPLKLTTQNNKCKSPQLLKLVMEKTLK